MAPRISIVMPTLNQAGFIAESVQSVMAQGVDGLELVVADGGSSDGTLALLASLSQRYAGSVHWMSRPDGGPAQAVNAAVERASGSVIGWLNSDDLYAPGAVARALAHLDQAPDDVMVYGEAEHIDDRGVRIGRYPTRPPQTPLAQYAEGCHICQPSAFFRRETFEALGGLDTSLRASFDFDFWLRLLKAYPGRVGFVPELQALSRLHTGAITARFRERVAFEGLQVVRRNLDIGAGHWLQTHFAELLSAHPFERGDGDIEAHLRQLAAQAEPWLGADGVAALLRHLADNRALRLSRPNFGTSLHADGWAGPMLDLRLCQGETPVSMLRLRGRHVSPLRGPLRLSVATPEGVALDVEVAARSGGVRGALSLDWLKGGRFAIDIPVLEQRCGARLLYRVSTLDVFVPAKVHAGSGDQRQLAYQVESVDLLPAVP